MISIVIPLYNKEKYVARAIKSVLNQTYLNYELIIVNDGSTDNSLQSINHFKDHRIKIFNKPNEGVAATRNFGIIKSKGNYIALLDADDEWLPNHLENLYSLITNCEKAKVFSTNFFYISKGKTTTNRTDLELGYISNYFKKILVKPILNSSTVCIEKTTLLKTGLFDQNLTHGEDINLWCELARNTILAYHPEPTSKYYLNTQNNSSTSNLKLERTGTYHIKLSKSINFYDFTYSLIRILKLTVVLVIRKRDFKGALKLILKSYGN